MTGMPSLEPQQVFALVTLLATLGLWLMVYRGDKRSTRWFRQWESDRRERRLAEEAAERGDPAPHAVVDAHADAETRPDTPPRGPWS